MNARNIFGQWEPKADDKSSFLSFVIKSEDTGCWIWTGGTNPAGYGRFTLKGHIEHAHRAAYILFVGPIPDGKLICHKCDNPSCVNPDHLFSGSQRENILDAVSKGRHKTVFVRGAKHPGAKLDEAKASEIKRLYVAGGTTYRELAQQFGVSAAAIQAIVIGRNWGHV